MTGEVTNSAPVIRPPDSPCALAFATAPTPASSGSARRFHASPGKFRFVSSCQLVVVIDDNENLVWLDRLSADRIDRRFQFIPSVERVRANNDGRRNLWSTLRGGVVIWLIVCNHGPRHNIE